MASEDALNMLNVLYGKLTDRAPLVKKMDAYYRGDHPLPFLTKAHQDKIRSEFRQMLDDSRSNFMRLVIDATAERLTVSGFRLSAESDIQADKDSWDIWQANNLDSLSRTAFLETLIKGVSYFSVWSPEDGDDYARIAVEDALETIIAYTPGSNFTERDAALKAWADVASGMERANVYMPDGIYKYERPLQEQSSRKTSTPQGTQAAGGGPRWQPVKDDEFVTNPIGVVPIVALRNRPRLLVEGESEIADHIQIQNQINSFNFLLALAGYFGAHRQRWVAGIKMETDEAKGTLKEPFDVAIDKLWASEDPDTKFGDFQQTDLNGYMDAIHQKLEHLAVVSRTPRHYFTASGQEPSGDAIKSAESGLVKKVINKQEDFGDGLEEMLRLARLFQGESDLPVDSEVVWADPAVESEAVRTDAAVKKYAAGLIPKEQALEDLGYSQTEIARIMAIAAAEKLLNPPAPVVPGAGPQPVIAEGQDELPTQPTVVKPQTLHA